MGGSAFTRHVPPLPTPRMPLSIYNLILSQTLSLLRQHYAHVASPIEAPGKPDYGDIDIALCSPLTPDFDPTVTRREIVTQNLVHLLGAKAVIVEHGSTSNFAVPWPSGTTSGSVEGEGEGKEEEEARSERYVQIDVKILPSLQAWKYNLFHAAHGDLWNILGTTIRPFGLMVNDKGLWLRIPEIESLDRKKSMIFLTGEPGEILAFLGLDEERWWREFPSRRELFEFAAECRMFFVREKREEVDGEEMGEGDVLVEVGAQEGGESGKKKLKHNDRQRMQKRPIFKEWIEDFVPLLREEGRYGECRITREQIKEEAFEKWGVKSEYEERLSAWKLTKHEDELWREVIKGSIPIEDVDPQFRAAAIRQMKAVIMEGEEWEGVVPPAANKNEEGFHDLEVVRAFVLENWRKAGQMGWERQMKRNLEAMKAKEEQKKLKLAASTVE